MFVSAVSVPTSAILVLDTCDIGITSHCFSAARLHCTECVLVLLQLVNQPDQHKKRSYAAAAASSDPIVLDGHDADIEDDAEHFGELQRNNSSTGLAGLAHVIKVWCCVAITLL